MAGDNPIQTDAPARWKRNRLWVSIVLALITVAVYLPTVRYEFINYDDPQQVYQNIHITEGLTWEGVKWSFGTNHWAWFPLTFVSHMIDCELFGIDPPDDASVFSLAGPAGHHLVNVLFHAANAVLLLWVLYRMTRAWWASFMVAAVFALHPLHVESVAWITERKDVLFMFFGLWAMWFYIGYAQKPDVLRYLGVFVFMALGLMCKSMLVTLPCLLLLLDVWPLGRIGGLVAPIQPVDETKTQAPAENRNSNNWPWTKIGLLIAEKLPLLGLSIGAASILLFAAERQSGVADSAALPLQYRIANAFVSYARYIDLMFAPRDLAMLYPHPGKWPIWLVAVSVSVFVMITALCIWQFKRRPYLMIGWLWYVGTSVPIIGLIQAGDQARADRFTYLPMIGLTIMVVWTVRHWLQDQTSGQGAAVVSMAGKLVILAMIIATSLQLPYWKNSVTIWTRTVAVTGPNYVTDLNLGAAVLNLDEPEEQRYQRALKYIDAALKDRPKDLNARKLKAHVLRNQGQSDQAIAILESVVEDFPENAGVLNDLGVSYLRQDDEKLRARSGELFKRALIAKPDYVEAMYNLAQVRAKDGQPEKAIDLLNRALKINPRHAASYRELGMVYYRRGRHGLARIQFQKATRLDPKDAEGFLNLAAAMFALGENATEQLNRSIELTEQGLDDTTGAEQTRLRKIGGDAYYLRAFVLKNGKQFAQAVEALQRCVELAPDKATAQLLLARLLGGLGRDAQAVAHYQKRIELEPKLADVHNEFGLLLAKLKRYADAAGQFRAALKLDPDHKAAAANLKAAQAERQNQTPPN